jgi:uncharacterized protein (UPF0371 family)
MADSDTFERATLIMEELSLKEHDRKVVPVARTYSARLRELKDTNETCPAMAIELADGTMITGKGSNTMDAAAAAVLNAIKQMAGISDELHLLSPVILEPIIRMKRDTFRSRVCALDCEEILIALSICAATNPMAMAAMNALPGLIGCQAHSTTILNNTDEQTYRNLGIDVTCDPFYATDNLYDG